MTEFEMKFWDRVRIGDGCWEWTGCKNSDGYGSVNCDGRMQGAHRVSWRMRNGEPGKMFVLHSCDNPPCVRPGHLFLGTQADNNADCLAKGRMPTKAGEANGRARLTAAKVSAIKLAYAGGKTCSQIVKETGSAFSTIYNILSGATWRTVQ